MPELPEVEVVARGLSRRLVGCRLASLRHSHPDVLVFGAGLRARDLRGQSVERVWRRGKLLGLDLGVGLTLTVHLRMTGRLWRAAVREPVEAHTHLRVDLVEGGELRFRDPRRFGRVHLLRRDRLNELPFLRTLGPEPFELSADDLRWGLAARRGSIKGVLLDQRFVAGLGNIYVDEVLFLAGVHPLQEADRLKESERVALLRHIDEVLTRAIERGGSSIRDFVDDAGAPGAYQREHLVFDREGEPCSRCGEGIRKLRVAGRGTHYCPGCQPRRRRRPRAALKRRGSKA